MRILKGAQDIPLDAFFLDANGDPATGLTLAEIHFDILFSDGSAPEADNVATRELGKGWYAFDYDEDTGKDFIYHVEDTTDLLKPFPGGKIEVVQREAVTGSIALVNDTVEKILFELTITSLTHIRGVRFDFVNLTQNCTIRVSEKVQAGAYVVIDSYDWETADEDGVALGLLETNNDVKFTIQSVANPGTPIVYWRYTTEEIT